MCPVELPLLDQKTLRWGTPYKFPFLDHEQDFIIFSNGWSDFSANLLIGQLAPVQHVQQLRYISPQRFVFFFYSSASKVHDLQAYKNMAMKSGCIILTFDPGGMLLSLQIGFSFVRDAEACAILEETSNFSHLLRHCILPCIKRLYIVPIFYQLLNSYTSYIYHVMEYAM